MNEPVIHNNGNIYERDYILEWLKTRNLSPSTNKPLCKCELNPNKFLKDIIEIELSKKHPFTILELYGNDV